MLNNLALALLCCIIFNINLFCQKNETSSNMTIGGNKQLIKIIAHTDSNLFVVSSKLNPSGVLDFYVSKHGSVKSKPLFDTCLFLSKIFKEGINPASNSFEFIQAKNQINLLFTAVGESGKILLGKIISYNGYVSEAFVIDKTSYANNDLERCDYKIYSTNKKSILVHVNRIFKNGFCKDKCILLDKNLNKIWDYDMPTLNAKTDENIIADVDNLNQLIYYPWKFVSSGSFDMNGNIIFQSVFRKINDTILPLNIGPLKYNQQFRKDSITLFFVNPINKSITQKGFYYPFVMMPIIKSITSTQLLMYSMVDVDDQNFVLIGKKAMYYKRFDLKNDKILLDTLVVLSEKMQQKLMHTYLSSNRHPTSKYFKLFSENLVDGNLISVYEHGAGGQFLEVFVSNFNIATNKVEWNTLLPRKINVYYPNIYDFVVRHFNGNTSVSFYEHRKNFAKNNENYFFNKYKLLRKPSDKKFISYTISAEGFVTKKNDELIDGAFLFPWKNPNYFFINRGFLPVNFINNN